MSKKSEKFISYENYRDLLFVFGAGASIADGVPLQKDLLPQILKESCTVSEPVKFVKSFIENNFDLNNCPSLESVFGYLDYFISKRESLGGEFTTAKLITIKEFLIRLIHHEISKPRNGKGVYREFWKAIDKTNKNISIITTNYDTLLDESFGFLYPNKALIDYCINFMNYEQPDEIEAFNWWINPRMPVAIWDDQIPVPIKIIKIHGSLNWKYCNCCNQVLLTPWNIAVDSNTLEFKTEIEFSDESSGKLMTCPNDNTPFDTFIAPPSHIKELNHPVIARLFDEAAEEIRRTKKIVFIGYSFPEADVHIKALFKKNLSKNIELMVVDPCLNEKIKSNYRSLSENTIFIDDTFENFIGTIT